MKPEKIVVPDRRVRSGETLVAFAEDLASQLGLPCERLPGAHVRDLHLRSYAPGDLLVSPCIVRRDVATIVPFDECGLFARGLPRRALIPLSNHPDSIRAASPGLSALAAFGFEALFWHTTWREDRNPSSDPRDHLGTEARAAIAEAEALANEAGLRHRTLIDSSDSVAYGIVLSALTEECPLIVMTRGRGAVRGSYVDSVLECSSVPVLVIGTSAEGDVP